MKWDGVKAKLSSIRGELWPRRQSWPGIYIILNGNESTKIFNIKFEISIEKATWQHCRACGCRLSSKNVQTLNTSFNYLSIFMASDT